MAFLAVRRSGTVSIMGVYGTPYDNFPLHRMFDKGLTIKQGQAPVLNYIDKLIELVKDEKVVLDDIITHRQQRRTASLLIDNIPRIYFEFCCTFLKRHCGH